jgi:hypothetical protein
MADTKIKSLRPQKLKAKLGKPLYQGTLSRDSMVLMTLAKQGTFITVNHSTHYSQLRDSSMG